MVTTPARISAPSPSLGDAAIGAAPTQPAANGQVEQIAQRNLQIFQQPEIRAGLFQLGISLLTPGSTFGSAVGDAAGAVGRYQQGQTDQQQALFDRQQQEAESARADEELAIQRQRSEQNQANIDRSYDLKLRQFGLDEQQFSLLKRYQEAQIANMGLNKDGTDDAAFDAAIKIYTSQLEAAGLTGGETNFNSNAFSQVLNGVRQSMGKPPIGGAGGNAAAALPIFDVDVIQAKLDQGVDPNFIRQKIQGRGQLTPAAEAALAAAAAGSGGAVTAAGAGGIAAPVNPPTLGQQRQAGRHIPTATPAPQPITAPPARGSRGRNNPRQTAATRIRFPTGGATGRGGSRN